MKTLAPEKTKTTVIARKVKGSYAATRQIDQFEHADTQVRAMHDYLRDIW